MSGDRDGWYSYGCAFRYTVDGETYDVVAEESNRPWGKGLTVRVFDGGQLRQTFRFSCHPEFDGYDVLQAKTFAELLDIAIAILSESGASQRSAREAGLTLGFRLNGRGNNAASIR